MFKTKNRQIPIVLVMFKSYVMTQNTLRNYVLTYVTYVITYVPSKYGFSNYVELWIEFTFISNMLNAMPSIQTS